MRISIPKVLAGATATGALALLVGGAAPAFASGNPVAITANVNQTISMTGPPASLALNGDPGTTASGTVNYTITTNATHGYSVSISPSSSSLANGGNLIANSAMGYSPDGGSQVQFSGANSISVNNKTVPSNASGDQFTDTFKLAIPGNAASGSYAETFTYLAIPNP